eukprot:12825766-Ditylum_brightwellii.AAC.1
MLPLLISLSNSQDAEVRQYSAYAMVKIAQNSSLRHIVTEEGGLEPVLYLARTDEPEIQREVLPAIATLSFEDSNKIEICKNGGLPPIIADICNSDDNTEASRLACCAVANLTEVVDNLSPITEMNAIPLLIQALENESPDVQREAARALGNLAANLEYGRTIVKHDILPRLIASLCNIDLDCKRMAAMALSNLASNTKLHSRMLEANVLDPLAAECRAALDPKSLSDHEVARFCLLAVANISVGFQNHSKIIDPFL